MVKKLIGFLGHRMDVDNTGDTPNGGASRCIDIDQSLLQQFSCMGTTDRDELISQLQKVLGAHLNHSTAAFYLDMNNWNLQAAIGSYLDVENSVKLPSMALASNPQANENDSVEPNAKFVKIWNIFNNGTDTWPANCYTQCAGGGSLNGEKQLVPCLQPGESYQISMELVSPSTPGTYQSKWRLCTAGGSYFGDPMWVIITVVEEGTMELTDQLLHLRDLGSPLTNNVPANPFRTDQLQNGNPDPDSHMC